MWHMFLLLTEYIAGFRYFYLGTVFCYKRVFKCVLQHLLMIF